ncbi:hypothetical protein [Neobacillus sp. SAB-20_R2A]|uniref:hypothetical protein n=1 Tax=Neobacillus sp. SAB-20_R2A TaxID=3120519 RepID=UPI003C6E2DC5
MYPILKTEDAASFEEFILFWESLYSYRPKHAEGNNLYFRNIHKQSFATDDILDLFIWKNGMTLSGKKSEIVKDICDRVEFINELKQSSTQRIKEEIQGFMNKSGVWQIFLLHITKPDYYPIFDQHTYRAYQFIKTGVIREISELKNINDFYFETYLPFIHEKLNDIQNQTERINRISKMDRALFAFGKFLKSGYAKLIGPSLEFEFCRKLFSSVYIKDKEQFSNELNIYLAKNPEKVELAGKLFKLRDFYMENNNYRARWDMGYFLMEHFNIEFEQSEGSELVFSLCCAIKDVFSKSDYEVGRVFKDIVGLQTV